MSTTDNNKLLAEFLGWHSKKINITASRPKGEGIELYLKEVTEYNREFIEDELKFHTDWNWLMQVVEKIEAIGGSVCIGNGNCVMIVFYLTDVYGESYSKTREMIGETKIQATYNACVSFVKWYNTQEL